MENCVELNGTSESLHHLHHLHHHGSESPSLELLTNAKELVSPVANLGGRKLSVDLNDIHQSNNVSNASQERARQELNENHDGLETRDMACQTRESIFESGFIHKSIENPVEKLQSFGYNSVSDYNFLARFRHELFVVHKKKIRRMRSKTVKVLIFFLSRISLPLFFSIFLYAIPVTHVATVEL